MKLRLYLKSTCLVLMVVLPLAGVRYIFKESSVHLQKVNILTKGELDYISKPQIINLIKPFQQETWWELRVSEVESALKTYPGIKAIKVQKKWPDQLTLELTEYQPKAYWNSQSQILLENGEIIAPKYFTAKTALPIFSGDEENKAIIADKYQVLAKIARQNRFELMDIKYQGNQWQVGLNTGVKVWLGDVDVENKLSDLLSNYQNIEVPKGQKLMSVDMRYHSGFAVGFAPDGVENRNTASVKK